MSTTYVDPVMLDSTGQDIVDKLDSIATLMGDGVIDDTSTATNKTWSAEKLNTLNGAKVSWDDASKSVKKNLAILYKGYSIGGNDTNGYSLASGGTDSCCMVAPVESGVAYKISKKNIGNRFRVIGLNGDITQGTVTGTELLYSESQYQYDFTNTGNYKYVGVTLNYNNSLSGQNIEGMVRLASVVDDTYVPYIPDNTELMTWEANGILGAKNILPFPYKVSSTSSGGVNVIVNNDGTLTVTTPSGASTSAYDFALFGSYGSTAELIDAGNYIASIENTNSKITIRGAYGSTTLGYATDNWNISAASGISYLMIRFDSGLNLDSAITLKPMLRLASDTDPTYAPYAMTNGELTEAVTPVHTSATAASNNVTLSDADFKSVVKVGKTVYFNVRFTISAATSTSVEPLVDIGYAPDALYPLFTLRKRLQPYEEVCGLYMGISGDLTAYGIELPAGDYWVTGTYICK